VTACAEVGLFAVSIKVPSCNQWYLSLRRSAVVTRVTPLSASRGTLSALRSRKVSARRSAPRWRPRPVKAPDGRTEAMVSMTRWRLRPGRATSLVRPKRNGGASDTAETPLSVWRCVLAVTLASFGLVVTLAAARTALAPAGTRRGPAHQAHRLPVLRRIRPPRQPRRRPRAAGRIRKGSVVRVRVLHRVSRPRAVWQRSVRATPRSRAQRKIRRQAPPSHRLRGAARALAADGPQSTRGPAGVRRGRLALERRCAESSPQQELVPPDAAVQRRRVSALRCAVPGQGAGRASNRSRLGRPAPAASLAAST